MKTLEELKKMREEALKKVEMRDSQKEYRVVVGMATCGIAAGARPVLNRLVEETAKHQYNCTVSQTGCIGMCKYEPIVEVFGKDGSHTTYIYVTPDKASEILNSHIKNGKVLGQYTVNAIDPDQVSA